MKIQPLKPIIEIVIILLFILMVLVFGACGDSYTKAFACTTSDRLQIAEFMTTNMKAANNLSDEEMEDVIKELLKTGVRLYCTHKLVPATIRGSIKWNRVLSDTSTTTLFY